jgi:hypothetical protein
MFSGDYQPRKCVYDDLVDPRIYQGSSSEFQTVSLAFCENAQHSVHPTGGSLRVFRRFVWLEVGSGKLALSRPTHQRVTQAVGWLFGRLRA